MREGEQQRQQRYAEKSSDEIIPWSCANMGTNVKARAQAANKGGKLHSQLSAQKRQSRSDTLKKASEQEQRSRDADDAARTRNWD